MNKVILTGNLCKNIELRTTESGLQVVSNSIAVRNDFKNSNGEYDTTFINFVAWKSQAEYLSKYAEKGDRLEIAGRWQNRTYEKDGSNYTVSECVVEHIRVFNKAQKDKEEAKLEPVQVDDSDLPF